MRKLSLSLLLLAGCFKAGADPASPYNGPLYEGPGCPGEDEFGPAGTATTPLVITMEEMLIEDPAMVTEELVLSMDLALMEAEPIMITLEDEVVWVLPVVDYYVAEYQHIHTDGPCPEACHDILVSYVYVGSIPLDIFNACSEPMKDETSTSWL